MMAQEIQIHNASAERLKIMAQRRDNKEHFQLEKAIRDGTEDFTKIPPEMKADCDLILAKPSTHIGDVWTDDLVDTVFEGKVTNILHGSIISILYSSETEATELSVYELVADIILEDANLLSD
ncbi:hypothetical protein BgiBS90_027734 [Biomphalaria glabrata]|nr:hypothetical protein BgiBS90_027734 [Biomphalaria glabrata]